VLAGQLVINPNTVARAYLELEQAGIVTKRHGTGTYVSEASSPLKRAERLKVLAARADALLAEARHLDVELDELVHLIRQRHRVMQTEENQ
jgi:GntR family transcriptional regulator